MTRLLWLAPSDMNLEAIDKGLPEGAVIYRYDRGDVPIDRAVLDVAHHFKPEVIGFVLQNGGPYVPSPDTLCKLRAKAKTVFFCFDASDQSWQRLLVAYRERGCFDLVVNIDGNRDWPGADDGLTLLTPIHPSFYGIKEIA